MSIVVNSAPGALAVASQMLDTLSSENNEVWMHRHHRWLEPDHILATDQTTTTDGEA